MNFNEYQKLSLRTEKTEAYIVDLKTGQPSLFMSRLDHGVVGLVTEVGELVESLRGNMSEGTQVPLDTLNITEELGDLCWYASLTCDALEMPFGSIFRDNIKRPDFAEGGAYAVPALLACTCEMTIATSKIVDVLKRWFIYKKDINRDKLTEQLMVLGDYIALSAFVIDKPLSDVLERNVAKLKARFPDGFTEDKAINRDLDAEKKALES